MRHIVIVPFLLAAGSLSALASVDSGLLALVPEGSKLVSSVDVTRARGSEFGQYLLSKSQAEDPHFKIMVEETGFDPRRDLQSVIFAASGPPSSSGPSSFAILARGTFDEARIEGLAKSKGAKIQAYLGFNIIVNNSEHGQQTAIGFPDVGIAVMGDLPTLEAILTNRATPTMLDPALQSKIEAVSASNDAWFASLIGGDFLGKQMPSEAQQTGQQQAKVLQSIVQASGGVQIGDVIQLSFDAVTRSPQDATSLTDVVRFFASMVQMQRQNDPRAGILASALDNMTLQANGNAVHVGLSVPEKTLEQLAEAAPQARKTVR